MFKRVWVDIFMLSATLGLFALREYIDFPPPLQLILLKAMLVSAGLLHAHIARKLLFPKIDWEAELLRSKHYAAISFYIFIPICYAFAG